HLDARQRPRQAIVAARPVEYAGVDQRPHDLLGEERIAARALRHEALERREIRVGAEEHLKQLRNILADERIKAELVVVRPIPPFVLEVRAVAQHEQQTRIRGTDDERVEETKAERIVPVKVLEDGDDRLPAALGQQQPDDRLIRDLPMLGWVERAERMLLLER